jgi:16S rRNA (guanine(527)-N(7))-methyltransferase RsmG
VKLSAGLISEVTGIKEIDQLVLERSERYCALLLEANRKINLFSRGGDQRLEVVRQFLISVAPLPVIPADGSCRWLDIGSGGGFPSIPLAIFRPKISFLLAESVAKKAFFLERAAETIELPNVEVIHKRIAPGVRLGNCIGDECFDWLSIKAVTDWEETLRWGASLLNRGGRLLTYKTDAPTTDQTLAIRDHGFELLHTLDLSSFFNNTRLRILLLKIIGDHN